MNKFYSPPNAKINIYPRFDLLTKLILLFTILGLLFSSLRIPMNIFDVLFSDEYMSDRFSEWFYHSINMSIIIIGVFAGLAYCLNSNKFIIVIICWAATGFIFDLWSMFFYFGYKELNLWMNFDIIFFLTMILTFPIFPIVTYLSIKKFKLSRVEIS